MGEFIRLQKILAQAGFGSRRSCETFILEGRVTVDGAVVRHLGTKADPSSQVVTLDGEKVAGPGKAGKRLQDQSEKVYYALNKPVGVLCTNSDPSGRPLAIQMIQEKRRLFCVGRLDLDTEGLLFLTNDGELAHLLTHPRFGVPKTYMAKVNGMVSGVQLAKLKKGVFLSEGRTQGAQVRVRKQGKKASTLEVTIQEGLNRQVRRMLAAVGLQCRSLRRVRVGPIALGAMPIGAYRLLSRDEVESLRRASSSAAKEHEPSDAPSVSKEGLDRPDRRDDGWAGERDDRAPRPHHRDSDRPRQGGSDYRRGGRQGSSYRPQREDGRRSAPFRQDSRDRGDSRSDRRPDRRPDRRSDRRPDRRERPFDPKRRPAARGYEGQSRDRERTTGDRYERRDRGMGTRGERKEQRPWRDRSDRPRQRDDRDRRYEGRLAGRGLDKGAGPRQSGGYQDRRYEKKKGGPSGHGGAGARPWKKRRDDRPDGRHRQEGPRNQDRRRDGI